MTSSASDPRSSAAPSTTRRQDTEQEGPGQDEPGQPAAEPSPDAFLTAVSVLDTLVRAGMRHVVLSPGSRSAPLAYALAAADAAGALSLHVRIDERTAGFTALGLAKSTGAPVGVVTTSGTAVGELLPAVMEAFMAEVPVAVLCADRPPRLRGTGANQTTWQPGIFGEHVRCAADLTHYPEEQPGPQTAAFMRCLAELTGRSPQDWSQASGQPLGPVQINCAFDTPLAPDARTRAVLEQWAQSLRGLEPAPAPRPMDATGAEALSPSLPAEAGAEGTEGAVVLAGDGAGDLARRFAEARGLPLLAEPSSNACAGTHAVAAAPVVLRGPLGARIRKVLLFGRPTLSRPVQQLLERPQVSTMAYRPQPVAWAQPGRRRETPAQTLSEAAAFLGPAHPAWLRSWQEAGARAVQEVEQALHPEALCSESPRSESPQPSSAAQRPQTAEQASRPEQHRSPEQPRNPEPSPVPGPVLAREVWEACRRDGAALLCGSSNLVRDLELLAAPQGTSGPGERFPVFANRGLAGIDGTLATAAGISLAGTDAEGEPAPVRVLLGDLTFLHDAGSLLFPVTERIPRLQVVVFNDAGGGIFSTLEHGQVGQDPAWSAAVERVFGTPQQARIADLVRGYGHQHVLAAGRAAAVAEIQRPWSGIRVVEVPGSRTGLTELHQRLRALGPTA